MDLVPVLKSHWKPVLVVVLVLGAFISGRYSAPTKVRVETQEKVVEKVVTVVQEKVVEVKVYEKAQERVAHRETTRTTKPDGTVTEHTEESTGESVKETGTDNSHAEKDTKTEETKIVVLEKKVEVIRSGPSSFIGPLVVFTPTAPAGEQFSAGIVVGTALPKLPFLPPLGISGSLSVPIHKPLTWPSVGLSITAGF